MEIKSWKDLNVQFRKAVFRFVVIYQLLFMKYPTVGGKHNFQSLHTVTDVDSGSRIKSRNDLDNDVQLISKFDQHFIGELPKNDNSVLVGCKNQKIGQSII